LACIVGNTCMHHLALDIDVSTLATPPYMPKICDALELDAHNVLPIAPDARLRVLPNIAGFVGADTVGCLVATDFEHIDSPTLMIDIGTNGEMVLGTATERLACSTAAGPAFEGALIECGMRAARGAIDHVKLVFDGAGPALECSVIGGGKGQGICGSGLVDAVAALLDAGVVNRRGQLNAEHGGQFGEYLRQNADGCKTVLLSNGVYLSQKDLRKVQMAKGAIRAGIELMAEHMGIRVADIQNVYLAGAFGNYLNPRSACRIGMLPPELEGRIIGVGNAAGEGAKACALSRSQFEYAKRLAAETEFLELASLEDFQERYIACTYFQ